MVFESGKDIRGVVKYDEPMSRHTSWRVGGAAKVFFKPADLDDLVCFLKQQSDQTEIIYLGLGSNLLIRDGGINGIVIAMQGLNQQLDKIAANRIRVDAGVSCAKTARFCKQHGLSQATFLAGIPGTMGGALAMNAGAFGGETWDYVVRVKTLDHQGRVRHREKAEFSIGYRHVSDPGGTDKLWFISAEMEFEITEDDGQNSGSIKQLLDKRNASQPIGLPSCGSVFTNPVGDHAARLIEDCGLKGRSQGNARISNKHANFIINEGGARAADIEFLIRQVQKTVFEKHGIRLVTEVRIIGENQA